jgi:hypothetical protein
MAFRAMVMILDLVLFEDISATYPTSDVCCCELQVAACRKPG